jgi:transglutaminase-like putative cysteine protease
MKLPALIFLLTVCKMVSGTVSISTQPDCAVLQYLSYYEIREGKLSQTDTIVIQINKRTGEDLCQVEIPFSKSDPIIEFSAWIEDTTGIVLRRLKRQEYTDVSEISDYSLYEDYFSRNFQLKHNVYPYRICYTYKITFRQFAGITNWYPVLDSDVPTQHAKLVLEIPKDYGIKVLEKNISPPVIHQNHERITRTWNTSYDGSLRSEIFCPILSGFLPSVQIVPLQFTYGCTGSTTDWQSFGKWQADLNQDLGNLPESEKRRISDLVGQARDKKEKVRLIYHYLQDNTRYINVTLDIGGMKPYPAEYVATNKYGDCKALTNYTKAMLNFLGIESYYTLVYSSRQPREISQNFPSQQFNHVVLVIPFDPDTLWLENTSNINPFGYAGTSIQNRLALLVDHDRSRLVRIPSLRNTDVRESGKMEFFLDLGDNAKVAMIHDFKGSKFELYNSLFTQNNRDEQSAYIHDHLPFTSFEIQDWKILKDNRDARNIKLETTLTVHHFVKSLGMEKYFTLVPLAIPDFPVPKSRKLPVQLPYPIVLSDTAIFHTSSYFNKIDVPQDTAFTSKFGRYNVHFNREGNKITVLREFVLHPGNISLDEYHVFYSFLAAIKTNGNRKILMQRK